MHLNIGVALQRVTSLAASFKFVFVDTDPLIFFQGVIVGRVLSVITGDLVSLLSLESQGFCLCWLLLLLGEPITRSRFYLPKYIAHATSYL